MKTSFAILFLFYCLSGYAQTPDKYLIKSRILADRLEFDKASETLSLTASKECTDYYKTQAVIAYGLKDYKKALAYFQLIPNSGKGIHQLEIARCYAQLGQSDEAISSLNNYLHSTDKFPASQIANDMAFQKIKSVPAWSQIWSNAEYSDLELKVNQLKSFAPGEWSGSFYTLLSNALNSYPDNSNLLFLQAKYFESNGSNKAALMAINQALRNKPDLDQLYYEKAEINQKTGNITEALASLDDAIRLNPFRLQYYIKRMTINRYLKDYAREKADMDLIDFCDPNNPELLYAKTLKDLESQNYLNALQNLNSLIKNDQTNPQYYLLRGQIQLKNMQNNKADEDFGMALDLSPNMAEANLGKGLAKYNLKETESACFYWQKSANEGNRDAKNYLIKYCK